MSSFVIILPYLFNDFLPQYAEEFIGGHLFAFRKPGGGIRFSVAMLGVGALPQWSQGRCQRMSPISSKPPAPISCNAQVGKTMALPFVPK